MNRDVGLKPTPYIKDSPLRAEHRDKTVSGKPHMLSQWVQCTFQIQGFTCCVYLVFAVEQQQVSEGDGGEGGLLQQEGQLLKTL